MSVSTNTLEQEAEATRARLADTADSLRSKMSPGQMMDEMASLFKGGDGEAALTNLKAQVRDNPLPLALVGAGLAWLMLGRGTSPSWASHTTSRQPEPRYSGQVHVTDTGYTEEGQIDWHEDQRSSNDEGVLSRVGEGVSDALDAGKTAVSDAAGAASHALGTAGKTLRQGYAGAKESAGSRANSASSTVTDLLEREPMITAAIGVVLGLVAGALLPRTDFEDEQMGAVSDEVKAEAGNMASKGVAEARQVAGESFEALKEAADDSGLVPTGQPLAERVRSVVQSAAEAGEAAVRDRLEPKSN